MKKRISPEFTTKSIRDARIPIFAFSTLWILFFHLSGDIGFPSGNIVWTAIRYFISFGNYGVDIFLILSAIGLSASMRKNKIKDFYYHRFKRVVIPYLIIALPFFVWYDLILHHSGLGSFIGNVSTVNYWIRGNHPTWYVAFILIAYLLFPCIYKLDKKSKHISTLSLIICSVAIEVFFRVNNFAIYTNCERALSRIPVFLLGVLLSDIFLDNQKIHKVFVPISVVIIGLCLSICVLLPTDIMIQRYLGIFVAFSFIVLISYFVGEVNSFEFSFSPIESVVSIIGKISFEIYISHVFILRFFKEKGLIEKITRGGYTS